VKTDLCPVAPEPTRPAHNYVAPVEAADDTVAAEVQKLASVDYRGNQNVTITGKSC